MNWRIDLKYQKEKSDIIRFYCFVFSRDILQQMLTIQVFYVVSWVCLTNWIVFKQNLFVSVQTVLSSDLSPSSWCTEKQTLLYESQSHTVKTVHLYVCTAWLWGVRGEKIAQKKSLWEWCCRRTKIEIFRNCFTKLLQSIW